MGRPLAIGIAIFVVVLISVAITVGLLVGLRKREPVPDLSASIIYLNIKETELMDINGVRVFGVKDFSGNVQAVHAVQTSDTMYMLDNDRLIQIQFDEYSFVFNYNDTSGQYYVMFISENSSYQIPSIYDTPTVKFPEVEVKFPTDANMSNPFTGVVIELQDSVSQQLISDAILQLNYHDEQYGNRSAVMINVGAGRYYALLPTNDTKMDKYFETKNLYETVSGQSNSLIELFQVYPMADILSKVPQTTKSFASEIVEEMSRTIPTALRTASKYNNRFPSRSGSSSSKTSHFEIVISIPGELAIIVPLDDVSIDPKDLTLVSRKAKTSRGKCNEYTVAGNDTPDDQRIDIGKGHVAIRFHYETFTVKDQIDVYYTNQLVFSSGCVGTQGERTTMLRLDDDETTLRVKVTPNCAGEIGTAWNYAIECPNQDLICDGNRCYCGLKQGPSRQVLEPTVDGCGAHRQKWNYAFIHAWGDFWKFTPVCDEHDRCYGTCNTRKATCDNSFCAGLVASCKTNWGTSSLKYSLCASDAIAFCLGVTTLASSAFKYAQHEDCVCDGT